MLVPLRNRQPTPIATAPHVRRWVFAGKILPLLLLVMPLNACSKAEQERKIAEVQKAADERVAKAEQEARDKIATLEKQVEAIKAEAADASAQAKAMADEAV